MQGGEGGDGLLLGDAGEGDEHPLLDLGFGGDVLVAVVGAAGGDGELVGEGGIGHLVSGDVEDPRHGSGDGLGALVEGGAPAVLPAAQLGVTFCFCESSLLRINQRHHSLGLGYGTHHRRQ